jgi:hypothetical protein
MTVTDIKQWKMEAPGARPKQEHTATHIQCPQMMMHSSSLIYNFFIFRKHYIICTVCSILCLSTGLCCRYSYRYNMRANLPVSARYL